MAKKVLVTKLVTTGRTAIAVIPVTTVDETELQSVNVSNPDTKPQLVIIRINSSGTFKVLKEITLAIGVKAVGLITHGQPLNDETITIDGKVYTYKTTLTGPPSADGEILIGGTAALTRTNLRKAMDLSGTAETDYGTAMTVHPTCVGVDNAANLDVQAKEMGTYANDIVVTESATNVTVVSPLAGGIDKSELQYNNPVLISQGDILEVILARAASTTELDSVCSYKQ